MIVDNKRIVNKLKEILPVYYDQIVEETDLPCITYYEVGNSEDNVSTGEMGYSNITFNVKIIGNVLEDILDYAEDVDEAMRELGYKRTSSADLIVDDIIQKVLTYKGLGFEVFINSNNEN